MLDRELRAAQAVESASGTDSGSGSDSDAGALEAYQAAYEASLSDPTGFWAGQARRLDWMRAPTRIKATSFEPGAVSIRWFEDGTLNVSANCIDRHVASDPERTAIIWEPDDPRAGARHVSYRELLEETSRLANVLKDQGVGRGDRVVIYLPMIPEAAYAMLACARIGAVHSVVFAGFSPDALANRINDCDARVLITADFAPRGGKTTALKANADAALLHVPGDVKCLVVKRTGGQTSWAEGRDVDLTEAMRAARPYCPPRWAPRTRSSSSTRRGAPASPRGRCTPRGATSSTPRSPTRCASTTGPATCGGARPTWAGSRATATSSTGRSPTAPRC